MSTSWLRRSLQDMHITRRKVLDGNGRQQLTCMLHTLSAQMRICLCRPAELSFALLTPLQASALSCVPLGRGIFSACGMPGAVTVIIPAM